MGEVLLPTKESDTHWTSIIRSNVNWRYQAMSHACAVSSSFQGDFEDYGDVTPTSSNFPEEPTTPASC